MIKVYRGGLGTCGQTRQNRQKEEPEYKMLQMRKERSHIAGMPIKGKDRQQG